MKQIGMLNQHTDLYFNQKVRTLITPSTAESFSVTAAGISFGRIVNFVFFILLSKLLGLSGDAKVWHPHCCYYSFALIMLMGLML